MDEKVRVLMVDDEKQFRESTRKLLTRRGFDVLLAESGEEAIDKLKENPMVVVLDIKMPGMDGHQALKEMKKRKPHIPVIMLTGHGAVPSAQEALEEGAFDYLAKPCDIDLLAKKITDAFRSVGAPKGEGSVNNVMIPFSEYTTVREDQTVKDAIDKLKASFSSKMTTSRIMETGHRSILVVDSEGKIRGILTIRDLLEATMPAYLSAPKPSTADSIQYSPMFWKGMFTLETKKLANRRIDEIMSPAPHTIDERSSIMAAAYMMLQHDVRRLMVVRGEEVVGIVREQDLFFEMERTLRE